MRALRPSLIFCVLAVAVACYLPGLTGHFVFDDGVNIRINPFLKIDSLDFSALWQAATSGGTNPLGRPISMASFAVNYYVFGMDPYYFKATNLAIHLLNGLLVFLLVKLLLGLHLRTRGAADQNMASWIGLAVAAIWLLHPFNLTGVLYVVQRMTSLSALFTLAGLVLYLYGRQCLLNGAKAGLLAIITALLVFTPLAALCKESGTLLPLFVLVTEATLLRWAAPDQTTRRTLMAIVCLTVAAPVLFGIFFVLKHPGVILDGYAWRDFSLTERLMTEARALWFYVRMIVLPSMSEMGLHHDDFQVSRGLLTPWTTLPAISGWLLLVATAFVLRRKQPMITFGVAFFLAGHTLESTIIPLELVFEHRNYLPMLGILLPLSYYALNSKLHLPSTRVRRLTVILLVVLFAGLTAARAQQWGNTLLMRTLEVERHPQSVRAHTDLANLYDYLPPSSQEDAIDLYNKARSQYQQAADAGPSTIAGLFGILVMNAHRGLPVEASVLETLEQRLETVPLGPPNMNTLIGAARDIADGHILVGPEIVDRIFRATMSNPLLTTANRRQIQSEFRNLPTQLRPTMEPSE